LLGAVAESLLTTRNVVLRVSRRKWERSYVAVVVRIDAGVALAAAVAAYVGRFGDYLTLNQRWDCVDGN
jgi:hypothetical protein